MLILASQSPRRKQLLEMANIQFEIIVEETDESFPPHLSLEEAPVYIARKKATVMAQAYPNRTILAADTVVHANNGLLGKPKNEQEASNMLQQLSNQTHQVHTGVALYHNGSWHTLTETTSVTFGVITDAEIHYYVEHYKPFDKAGGYAIQEWIGAIGIRKIDGCFYNVMGLPISRVRQLLKELYLL